MSPFFDQPGSNAGPYSTPAQPGILSKILAGVNVAMKLGDFYQDWQSKTQARENAGMQGVMNRVALAKAVSPDQPITATPELVKGAEGIWPKVTAAGQGKMAERVQPTIGPPVSDSPTWAGMAAIPGVGEYAPIQPTPSIDRMKMEALQGMAPEKRGEALFPKTIPNVTTVKGADGQWYQVPGRFATERVPGETSDEKTARQIAVKQATPGGKGGAGGGGQPEVITEAKRREKMFQEEKALRPDLTRMQFFKELESAKQQAKPNETTIIETPGAKMSDPTTKKITRGRSGAVEAPATEQQYTLPKGGQMVPVNKETYDAYQKKYGLK